MADRALQNFVNGKYVDASDGRTSDLIDPSTGEVYAQAPVSGRQDVDAAMQAAANAFAGWRDTTPSERSLAMFRIADAIEKRADDIVAAETRNTGKPVALTASEEVPPAVDQIRFFAGAARVLEGRSAGEYMKDHTSMIRREPIGVCAQVTPWNYPMMMAIWKIAPALAARNTVVLKPAPETVLDAFLMAEAALEAGLPPGVLNVVPAGREVGAYLVGHPGVDKVSFTGSTAAGRAIAETCGRLLRPVTLELGGKSAAIILDDADLTASLEPFFGTTLLNNGQICWLCTRVLAPRSRYDAVVETITALAQSLTIGDPLDPATKIGPLVSERQRDRVESYIAKGKADGGRITAGGRRPEGFDRGWFVEPTIFAGVDPRATIAQEEIFGPVLAVIPYADEQEAVAIANDSEYGLGGSVWTADPERGASFARKVRTGTIGVNGYVNDPFAPFGGVKASGMGRELGPEGLQPFQLLKTIYLDEANDPA